MRCFWTVIFLCFAVFGNKLSEAEHRPRLNKQLSSSAAAVVVGTVYCDTCFRRDLPETNHFIAGATVAVECRSSDSSRLTFRREAKTDSRGEFRVQLPFSVGKHVKTIKGCTVALVRSSQPSCAAAAAATSSSLRLKSRSGEERLFSAGLFTFKPQLCDQKQSTGNGGGRKPSTRMAFFLPPNPLNPGLLPPNPLLPPPSLLPPVLPTPPPSLLPPFIPTPPPSVIPPFLPTPPSSPVPFLPLPPIPGLVPSPSPPPPPSLPVPLPPLPFLPPPIPFLPPLIPGGPPRP